MEKKEELSAYGKDLLRQLGGSSHMVTASAAAVKRWGMDRPDSVLKVLPEEFQAQVLVLPSELLDQTEDQLAEAMGGITRQDRRVRINFWDEYESAHRASKLMNFGVVIRETGLPSWEIYQQRLYENPARLAWLMKPPASYALTMREAHELSLDRLMDILSLPLETEFTNAKGVKVRKINTGVGMLILQAIKLVDYRRMGAPTQKNVQVMVDGGRAPDHSALDMDAINKRLKELADQMGEKLPGITEDLVEEKPEAIDVESMSLDVKSE